MVSNYQLGRIQTRLGNDRWVCLWGINLITLTEVGRATLIVGGTTLGQRTWAWIGMEYAVH